MPTPTTSTWVVVAIVLLLLIRNASTHRNVAQPFVPLVERAVHPFFLLMVQSTSIDFQGRRTQIGDMLISDIVMNYIKPSTESASCDYLQVIACKRRACCVAAANCNHDRLCSVKQCAMLGRGSAASGVTLRLRQ